MWSPFYQLVVYNRPIFYPVPTTPLFSIPFPIIQTINIRPKPEMMKEGDEDWEGASDEHIIKEQLSIEEELPADSLKQLIKIMELVLAKIDCDPKALEQEIVAEFLLAKSIGKPFFATLISKLKKLNKTKEEIIKYCMRKAFKFVNEKLRQQRIKLPENDVLREFIKGMKDGNQSIPFKKDSQFKTMNSHFLSQLFQSPVFVQLYEEFLQKFPKICEIDNNRKVEHFAKTMLTHIRSKSRDFRRFNNFKRIPWTEAIMNRVFEIAADLQKYAEGSTKWVNLLTDK